MCRKSNVSRLRKKNSTEIKYTTCVGSHLVDNVEVLEQQTPLSIIISDYITQLMYVELPFEQVECIQNHSFKSISFFVILMALLSSAINCTIK